MACVTGGCTMLASSSVAPGRLAPRRGVLRVRASADVTDKPAAAVEAAPQAAAPAAAAAAAAPAALPSVRRPHAPKPAPIAADFLEVMSFNGIGPELINGRLAMIGFLAALGCEVFTQQTVLSQLGAGFKPVWWTMFWVIHGSLVPLFRGYVNDEAFGPLTPEVEKLNGRAAMVGFASLLLIEAFKGAPLF